MLRKNLPADGFKFTIEPYDSNNHDANHWAENPPMPDNREITIHKGSDSLLNSGSFGEISFNPREIYEAGKAKDFPITLREDSSESFQRALLLLDTQ